MTDVVYPKLSKRQPVKDFDEVTMHQFAITGMLQDMAETGKLEHLSMREVQYKTNTKVKGDYLQLPETLFIKDDLGALANLFAELGKLPELSKELVCAKTLIGMLNGTYKTDVDGTMVNFFSTDAGNSFDGSSTELGWDGLDLATQAIDDFDGLNEEPINNTGQFLLIPPGLQALAKQIYTSTNQNYSGDKNGEVNIWSGEYEPIVWKMLTPRRMEKNGMAPGTWKGTEWFLMADQQQVPIMMHTTVIGYETSIIDQVDVDGDVWGRAYQIIHPFHFTPMHRQGAIFMKGRA